ncbi:MAG: hypothetical protein IPL27_27085 [Lewinellaceae bacterium]|nr:hypothetical protein [Lewinellaceae bacterium]
MRRPTWMVFPANHAGRFSADHQEPAYQPGSFPVANNIIIDGNGVTVLRPTGKSSAIGDGGSKNWQFSVDRLR